MKKSLFQFPHRRRGFTLIELLVVISIIAILAGLLLPVIAKARTTAKIAQAKVEINGIAAAISKYEADYSRFPASQKLRANAGDGDFTFGTIYLGQDAMQHPLTNKKTQTLPRIANGYPYENCNAEVMAALLDRTNYFLNFNHAMNPNKIGYLTAKEVNDKGPSPGVGADGVYRDPWANPYIITVDLNYDNKCRDGFYRNPGVSKNIKTGGGFNGLAVSETDANVYEARVTVMVWSLGPDGLVNPNIPSDQGANKDNILSWK